MILFNLLTLEAAHATAVTELLLREEFTTDVFVDEAIANYHRDPDSGAIVNQPLFRVIFLTKAMLYRDIENMLAQRFPGHNFRYYATAVTQVDDREADRIRNLVRPV